MVPPTQIPNIDPSVSAPPTSCTRQYAEIRLPIARKLPTFNSLKDEVGAFRRIHVVENNKAVETLDEAEHILLSEPEHAGALKFRGWWLLAYNTSEDSSILAESIDALERSLQSSEWVIHLSNVP